MDAIRYTLQALMVMLALLAIVLAICAKFLQEINISIRALANKSRNPRRSEYFRRMKYDILALVQYLRATTEMLEFGVNNTETEEVRGRVMAKVAQIRVFLRSVDQLIEETRGIDE